MAGKTRMTVVFRQKEGTDQEVRKDILIGRILKQYLEKPLLKSSIQAGNGKHTARKQRQFRNIEENRGEDGAKAMSLWGKGRSEILKQLGSNVFVLFVRAEASRRKSVMTQNSLFTANAEQLHGPVRKDKPCMEKLLGADTYST